MSASKKILVVLGATGNQGGSVARTFLNDASLSAQWHVRGVTRNPSSAAAVELSKLGAEMVTASLNSGPELRLAFEGASAIFVVTDFWGALQDSVTTKKIQAGTKIGVAAQETEEEWGRNITAAAADIPTLDRLVFSTLPAAEELSQGKLKHIHHFDGKANIAKHIQQSHPSLWSKTSQIIVGNYNTNILPDSYFGPVYNPQTRRAEFVGPVDGDIPIPFINVALRAGPFVKALILDEPAGLILAAYDVWQSPASTASFISRLTGKSFVYVLKSVEELAASSPLGLELPETNLFVAEYGLFGEKANGWKDTLTWPSDLKRKAEIPSLEQWLKEQDWDKVFPAA